ncbi:MAG: peptidoglycan editing factor PgeF [Caldilineales bacterium]
MQIDTDSTTPLARFDNLRQHTGLIHAVSTRQGGVSRGPFASLNLGKVVGDDAGSVETNYRLLADALGVPRSDMTTTWQVHSDRIVRATRANAGGMIDKADGIVTDVPGLPITQRYADCTPVLVYDPRGHAVGVAHAGWRGTVAGVTPALVRAMVEHFGSDPADLVGAVGPAIGPCCYEVGQEVVDAAGAVFADVRDEVLLPVAHRTNGNGADAAPPSIHFDLWRANQWQFQQAGVQQVEVAGICTRCHRDMFFSHRGDHGVTGRFGAVAMLRL